MELGIGMFGDLTLDVNAEKYLPVEDRMQEIIEEVKLADKIGIDVFLMGEHHRPDFAVAAPEIMLASLATITKNIKLASGVTVLSSSDPVKVYQDFAMIDLISKQRAEIVAGRGSFIESFPLFGYDLSDYNELFEEKLDLLYQLNEKESITWSGKFRPALKDQTIYPRPGRKLPLWIAVGGTPSSIVRSAKYGIPLIIAIIGGTLTRFVPAFNLYRERYKEYGHSLRDMQVGGHFHTAIADSRDELIDGYFPHYAAMMNRIGKERGWPSFTLNQFVAGMQGDGALFMGTPEQVAEKMIRTIELFGLTRFIAHIDVGGPSHAHLMRTIELYGNEVLPRVKSYFKKEK